MLVSYSDICIRHGRKVDVNKDMRFRLKSCPCVLVIVDYNTEGEFVLDKQHLEREKLWSASVCLLEMEYIV